MCIRIVYINPPSLDRAISFFSVYISFLVIFFIISISSVVGIHNIISYTYKSDLPNTPILLSRFRLNLSSAIVFKVSVLICVIGWFGWLVFGILPLRFLFARGKKV